MLRRNYQKVKISSPSFPSFGKCLDNRDYYPRPGSYAIIPRNNLIAIIRTKNGYHLPGGGAKSYESKEDTLHREVMEEIGCRVKIIEELGTAIDYIHSQNEGYFKKICTYYYCELLSENENPSEIDHILEWINFKDALDKFNFGHSQYWALNLYYKYRHKYECYQETLLQ